MSRGKIIVVEDDRDIREGLCELLVRDGYDVAACGSVQEAERSIAGGGAICTCSMSCFRMEVDSDCVSI